MAITPKFFKVFDTETTGLSHHYDQVIQFAGVTLDNELNFVEGDNLVMDIKLRPDVVPSPYAFAVHGIEMERLNNAKLNEFEAAGSIREWMMNKQGSFITGYNSQSFDDEVVRNMFYRNMINPYEHEWKDGNNRLDIFRLVMFVYALRPESLNWPVDEEGKTKLKLGMICEANGIKLENAHDALADVIATVELMRLIKKNNPAIWNYFIQLSDKREAQRKVQAMQPLVLVDRFLPRDESHLSIVKPVIYDAQVQNKMLAVDLRFDPTELLSLSSEEIKRRVFSSEEGLEPGEGIRSIRSITTNKQAMICDLPLLTSRPDIVKRSAIDLDLCEKHAKMIDEAGAGFRQRLQDAFVTQYAGCRNVYEGIYQLGFIERAEEGLRRELRGQKLTEIKTPAGKKEVMLPRLASADPQEVAAQLPKDRLRLYDLTLRAKWAHYPRIAINNPDLKEFEMAGWNEHMDDIWYGDMTGLKNRKNLEGFKDEMSEVRARFAVEPQLESVLNQLEKHVEKVTTWHSKMKEAHERLIGVTMNEKIVLSADGESKPSSKADKQKDTPQAEQKARSEKSKGGEQEKTADAVPEKSTRRSAIKQEIDAGVKLDPVAELEAELAALSGAKTDQPADAKNKKTKRNEESPSP